MPAPDWVDHEIETKADEAPLLNAAQIKSVLGMTEMLRDPDNLAQVLMIKQAIVNEELHDAMAYWAEFTENEQHALWVAPTYGGIFTTSERTIIKKGIV